MERRVHGSRERAFSCVFRLLSVVFTTFFLTSRSCPFFVNLLYPSFPLTAILFFPFLSYSRRFFPMSPFAVLLLRSSVVVFLPHRSIPARLLSPFVLLSLRSFRPVFFSSPCQFCLCAVPPCRVSFFSFPPALDFSGKQEHTDRVYKNAPSGAKRTVGHESGRISFFFVGDFREERLSV